MNRPINGTTQELDRFDFDAQETTNALDFINKTSRPNSHFGMGLDPQMKARKANMKAMDTTQSNPKRISSSESVSRPSSQMSCRGQAPGYSLRYSEYMGGSVDKG